MKELNIELLQNCLKQVETVPEGQKYAPMIFPLEWLNKCGWDKIAYDDCLLKYTAGTLDQDTIKPFEVVYKKMLKILATMELMSAKGVINYNFYKTAMEQYGGSGLVSQAKQNKIKDRVEKFKKQQELKNESGLSF